MLDLRSPLTRAAAPVGLTAAALLWLLAGQRVPSSDRLDALGARLADLRAPRAPAGAGSDAAARALAVPIFALATEKGGRAELQLGLAGLAIAKGRQAALVSVGGQPPAWLEVGQSRDGATLVSVGPARAVIDTPTGLKTLDLGASPAPGQAAPK